MAIDGDDTSGTSRHDDNPIVSTMAIDGDDTSGNSQRDTTTMASSCTARLQMLLGGNLKDRALSFKQALLAISAC
jgi:hypothetical protein